MGFAKPRHFLQMEKTAMFTRFTLVLLVGFLAVPHAFADYYKYRDQDGVLRFTDNLGEVPAGQRPKTERYRETKPVPQLENKPLQRGRKKTRVPSTGSVKKENQTQAQWLIQEQRDLDRLHKLLLNEKMALANDSQHIQTPVEAKEYRKDLNNLNQRIAKFEKRRYSYSNQAGKLQDQIKKEKQRQNRPKYVVSSPRACGECDQKSAAQ
jgi:hypothetical protein